MADALLVAILRYNKNVNSLPCCPMDTKKEKNKKGAKAQNK